MKNKRRDGIRIKDLDGYHKILPYIMPKRTEAEVSLTEQFDVTELVKYMAERNEEEGVHIKLYHSMITAIAKTVYHRPRLNWFISGRFFYERPDITFSFVVKQKFADDGEETLMFMKVKPDMNIDSISKLILGDVKKVREEKTNDLDKLMEFVGSLPRPFLEVFFATLRRLEYHGVMPKGLTAGDPNYSSVMVSNLGSIGSDSCYHHLSNYGTCSVMITIGKMHKEMKYMEDGSWQERDVLNCTFTIDERLADGFYFAKSLRIMKYLLENPRAMEEPISETVPVEL